MLPARVGRREGRPRACRAPILPPGPHGHTCEAPRLRALVPDHLPVAVRACSSSSSVTEGLEGTFGLEIVRNASWRLWTRGAVPRHPRSSARRSARPAAGPTVGVPSSSTRTGVGLRSPRRSMSAPPPRKALPPPSSARGRPRLHGGGPAMAWLDPRSMAQCEECTSGARPPPARRELKVLVLRRCCAPLSPHPRWARPRGPTARRHPRLARGGPSSALAGAAPSGTGKETCLGSPRDRAVERLLAIASSLDCEPRRTAPGSRSSAARAQARLERPRALRSAHRLAPPSWPLPAGLGGPETAPDTAGCKCLDLGAPEARGVAERPAAPSSPRPAAACLRAQPRREGPALGGPAPWSIRFPSASRGACSFPQLPRTACRTAS